MINGFDYLYKKGIPQRQGYFLCYEVVLLGKRLQSVCLPNRLHGGGRIRNSALSKTSEILTGFYNGGLWENILNHTTNVNK